jgi:hypothetical protein
VIRARPKRFAGLPAPERISGVSQNKHAIYVLHAFQKMSKKGIATPKLDIDTIKERFKVAVEHFVASKQHPPKVIAMTNKSGITTGRSLH